MEDREKQTKELNKIVNSTKRRFSVLLPALIVAGFVAVIAGVVITAFRP